MYQPALTSQATTAAMRTARKLIPANDMAFLQPVMAASLAGNEPLREAVGNKSSGRAIAVAKAVASCRFKIMYRRRKAAQRPGATVRRCPHRRCGSANHSGVTTV